VLNDGQVFESKIKVTIAGKQAYRRAIYQFRSRRAREDLANIDKLLAKAQRMVAGKSEVKRNRFLQIIGGRKEINTALVNRARMRAGIKGYITNLDIPAQQVIDYYHQLFQVEKSFRMAKSDLKARPIFHHKRESIDAHLTIVFAALAISRRIEHATKISIRRFVQKLAPLRTGIISINGAKQILPPWVPQDISILLASLAS
jgi:transposase